jgi:hypothetical protein
MPLLLPRVSDSITSALLQALPNLIGLSLPCTTPGSAIVDLLPLTRLQFLSLNSNCDFTCQDVALLTTLKTLCLEDCKLDTDDLLELRPLTNLTALSLSMNEAITDVSSLEVIISCGCSLAWPCCWSPFRRLPPPFLLPDQLPRPC